MCRPGAILILLTGIAVAAEDSKSFLDAEVANLEFAFDNFSRNITELQPKEAGGAYDCAKAKDLEKGLEGRNEVSKKLATARKKLIQVYKEANRSQSDVLNKELLRIEERHKRVNEVEIPRIEGRVRAAESEQAQMKEKNDVPADRENAASIVRYRKVELEMLKKERENLRLTIQYLQKQIAGEIITASLNEAIESLWNNEDHYYDSVANLGLAGLRSSCPSTRSPEARPPRIR